MQWQPLRTSHPGSKCGWRKQRIASTESSVAARLESLWDITTTWAPVTLVGIHCFFCSLQCKFWNQEWENAQDLADILRQELRSRGVRLFFYFTKTEITSAAKFRYSNSTLTLRRSKQGENISGRKDALSQGCSLFNLALWVGFTSNWFQCHHSNSNSILTISSNGIDDNQEVCIYAVSKINSYRFVQHQVQTTTNNANNDRQRQIR